MGLVLRARLLPLLVVSALPALPDDASGWKQVLESVLLRAEANVVESKTGVPQGGLTPVPESAAGTSRPGDMLPAAVSRFVQFFRRPGVSAWRASMIRLAPVEPAIRQVLHEEGVPADLLWIGVVESAFDSHAISSKGAAGVWQLMPETAAAFGLNTGPIKDERFDAVKSSRAAARYLRYLYSRFGDWPLTFAAYNAGQGRVQAAIDKTGTRDVWRLIEAGALPAETQAYVPAVLAAQLLGSGQKNELQSNWLKGDDAPKHSGRILIAPISLSSR